VETAPPPDALIVQYLAHYTAYGRSPNTISHYQDTFKLFTRFLLERHISPNRRALTATTIREFATWLCVTPLERTRRSQRQRSETGIHEVMEDLRAFIRWLY
jgi:site-specific recombinase XerD